MGIRTLYLLRHGQTTWNVERRTQGHADVPLSEVGVLQAKAAAPYVSELGITQVWASDLARARQTAEIVTDGWDVPVAYDDAFREFATGERTGLTLEEIAVRFPFLPEGWELDNPPPGIPGAEVYADVAARIVPAARAALDALGPDESGLIVAHGACLKVLIAGLLGWDADVAGNLGALGNCHLARLHERPEQDRVWLSGYNLAPISHP